MADYSVRIESVTIENFKNVAHGKIGFENKNKSYKASILGLYGQNGSGKTALIDALQILKIVLSGMPVPEKYADYIRVDTDKATLAFEFRVCKENEEYRVWYSFALQRALSKSLDVTDEKDVFDDSSYVEVCDELISFSYRDAEKLHRKTILLDTRSDGPFLPKMRLAEVIQNDNEKYLDLIVGKKLAGRMSKSFIFSREMMMCWKEHTENDRHLRIVEVLSNYAIREFFVISTANSGLISMNALPLMFKLRNEENEAVGRMLISLDKPSAIPQSSYELVGKIIDNLNGVLEQLVPGLRIGVVDLGIQIAQDGETVRKIQLVSLKNGKEIPFCYESEGIKKIVSVLQLLIVVFNYPSVTVAIDELDSGVYEYLLGELLSIISEKGKGQLIFTSHNLRPLETIDKGFISFTTVNPENRYIRLENVKTTNNLRDFYYRDIILGGQKERIYNTTDSLDIAFAFREAGEAFGT